MATNRITPSSSLIDMLRTLAQKRSREPEHVAQPGGLESNRPAKPVSGKHEVQILRQRLHELANTVDPNDAQSMQHARNQVVREILLWEFGSDFRTDSQFLPMVETIGKTLETDAGFHQRFVELIIDLRKN